MDEQNDNLPNTVTKLPTSRRALMLGAAAASAIVTVRPALAQTAGSVLNCQIPVPGPHGTGMNIDAYGRLVTPDTAGSLPPPDRNLPANRSSGHWAARNCLGQPMTRAAHM